MDSPVATFVDLDEPDISHLHQYLTSAVWLPLLWPIA
jgi:hypothetical protein